MPICQHEEEADGGLVDKFYPIKFKLCMLFDLVMHKMFSNLVMRLKWVDDSQVASSSEGFTVSQPQRHCAD